MDVGMVRMPLIRIAHPTQEQCQKEVERIEAKMLGQSQPPIKRRDDNVEESSDDSVKYGGRPVSKNEVVPNLFKNFEHHYDPELTPRKAWKAQVINLDSMLKIEEERYRQLQKESIEKENELERDLVQVNSKLNEALERCQNL